jgi:FkbM family methyltransferase
MTVKHWLKEQIRDFFWRRGYELKNRSNLLSIPTLGSCFERLKRRGDDFRTVIDIGASNGSWSLECMRYYPNARYLLVEAQPVHEAALKAVCQQHPSMRYVMAAAGKMDGHIYFDASDPFGGVASTTPTGEKGIEVKQRSLDSLLLQHADLEPPYLIKLDTHGFEPPILEGARAAMGKAGGLVIECYNFKISPEALTFPEMCLYLERMGFKCMDMFDFIFREKDGAFWQMDILFMRSDRPEFKSTEFR